MLQFLLTVAVFALVVGGPILWALKRPDRKHPRNPDQGENAVWRHQKPPRRL